MWRAALWATVLLCAAVDGGINPASGVPASSKCGRHCGEDMGKEDRDSPAEDLLPEYHPHVVRSIAKNKVARHMNAYGDDQPGPEFGHLPNLPSNQRIPYTHPGAFPPERRPCALDSVVNSMLSVRTGMVAEQSRDKMYGLGHETDMRSAKATYDSAKAVVIDLKRAKIANDTLFDKMAVLTQNALAIEMAMTTKAGLLHDINDLRGPIDAAIGRITLQLQQNNVLKVAALNDHLKAPDPGITNKMNLYSELEHNLKMQVEYQQNLAGELIMPLRQRLTKAETQLASLRNRSAIVGSELEALLPAAAAFSEDALTAAEVVLSDAGSHYMALKSALDGNQANIAQCAEERIQMDAHASSIQTAVALVLQPQDMVVMDALPLSTNASQGPRVPSAALGPVPLIDNTNVASLPALQTAVRPVSLVSRGAVPHTTHGGKRALVGLVGRFAAPGPYDDDTPADVRAVGLAFENFGGTQGSWGHLVSGQGVEAQDCPPNRPWSASLTLDNFLGTVVGPLEELGYEVDVAIDAQYMPQELWMDILSQYRARANIVSARMDATPYETQQWSRRLRLMQDNDAEWYDTVVLTRPDLVFLSPLAAWNISASAVTYTWDEIDDGDGRYTRECDVLHVIPQSLTRAFEAAIRTIPANWGPSEQYWGQVKLISELRAAHTAVAPMTMNKHTCGVSVGCQGRNSLNPLYYMEGRMRAV